MTKTTISKEWNLLRTAVMFYTRVPVGKNLPYSPEMLNQATKFFPLIGILAGLLTGALYLLLYPFVDIKLAVALSMAAGIIFTGAFHEDGFADFCDGFGCSTEKTRILDIMKDSRIGTYGAIGLFLMLGSKFLALSELRPESVLPVLLAAHASSRLMPVLIIRSAEYVREDALSKAKPVGKRIKNSGLLVALLLGLIPFCLLPAKALIIIPALAVLTIGFRWYIQQRIGGYTGDCLGALQQLSELCFYILFIALC